MAEKHIQVFFEPQEIGKDDWQLRVIAGGAELEYVTGFRSKADAEKWRASPECRNWLEARGYAK